MKKLSELMLEGYAMVGKQCKNTPFIGPSMRPTAVCALGAARLAFSGDADDILFGKPLDQLHQFERRVGFAVYVLSDKGMSIPDIAGIAAAEGL